MHIPPYSALNSSRFGL